ncbi:MAG TPA: small ribosomal subunit Rsm22 family protein [Kofleriaceae bacterium]|nr:small ribosomal subunit Rsm22 family protein [Kofleriaceae bacterium]
MRAAARAELGDAPLATGALVRSIVDRSLRYTSERERLAAPADRTGDLAARAAFFTIADAMKVAVPLGELCGRGALPARRPLRVVDLGAGCGAMSLGLLAALGARLGARLGEPGASPEVALSLVDRDAAALAIAAAALRALAAQLGVTAAVTTRAGDAVSAPLDEPDLVVIGSLLNELTAADPRGGIERATSVVARALDALPGDGAVIVIEPALRETSRALHEIRDAILARGAGHVFAPCTRRGAPCTALADPTDWCHEDRPLELPPRTAELARLTHLRDSGMKFSYLVLRRQPLALVPVSPGGGEAWRVVGVPRPEKGKLEVIGCGERGRVPIRLLRRHRAPENRAIERAARGDVLVVDAAPGEGPRVELDEATRVERIEPARRTEP